MCGVVPGGADLETLPDRRLLDRRYRGGRTNGERDKRNCFQMRWLIVGEYSGRFRDALIRRGHDAVSCDFLPTEVPGPHIQDDARRHLHRGWDGVIAHPECTYNCNSGVKHMYIGGKKANGFNPERHAQMVEKLALFKEVDAYDDIPLRAIENPIPHAFAVEEIGRGPDGYCHPYWFGDPFFKTTGWWLRGGLQPLRPTDMLTPPKPGTDEHKRWSAVHRAPPRADRWRERSRTFPGMAEAGAEQWGGLASRLRVLGARL